MARRALLLWPLLIAALALALVRSEPGSPPALRIAGLRVLRGPLPPPEPAEQVALGAGLSCPRPAAPLDRALYDHLPAAQAALSCGNRFGGLLPFPPAGRSYGSYAVMAGEIRAARREVLIANMVWDADPTAPGALLARALADLRAKVRRRPGAYPQGVTVRVLLGNSVRFDSPLDPTTNVYNAATHLLAAGLTIGERARGWRLEVANARYAFPHSHMKLMVVDGQTVNAGGYNISNLHLGRALPGGAALSDLGLRLSGPVAQQAAASFHDAWRWSQALTCLPGARAQTVRRDCDLGRATTPYPLTWLRPLLPTGTARVYGLYRRSGWTGSDDALSALLAASRSHLDLLQSQVSGDLSCDLSLLFPGGCAAPGHLLPPWRAVLGAIRDHGVRVRLVLDRAPVLQTEALELLGGLWPHLRSLGLEDRLEVRWSGDPGGMHTKVMLVDGQMVVVGSSNLHFSSFGPGGLTEYNLATSDPGAIRAVQAVFDDEWRRGEPVRLPFWLR